MACSKRVLLKWSVVKIRVLSKLHVVNTFTSNLCSYAGFNYPRLFQVHMACALSIHNVGGGAYHFWHNQMITSTWSFHISPNTIILSVGHTHRHSMYLTNIWSEMVRPSYTSRTSEGLRQQTSELVCNINHSNLNYARCFTTRTAFLIHLCCKQHFF